MNPKCVEPQETLYRGVLINPFVWNDETNRPSSAAFKQTSSLSVDREGGRSKETVFQSLKKNVRSPLKAIAWFSAKHRFERRMEVRPDPTETNQYHTLIDDNEDTIGVGTKNAKFLARRCEFSLLSITS